MSVATASGLEEKQCQYWLLGSLHTTDIEDDDEDVIRATGGKFRMCVCVCVGPFFLLCFQHWQYCKVAPIVVVDGGVLVVVLGVFRCICVCL